MWDEKLHVVGEDKCQPPPPKGGIPRQYLPSFIRVPIKLLILPFVLLDQCAMWVAKKIVPPPFKKVGKCKKRGNCCYYILIRKTRWAPAWLDLFWHTQINGFYRREEKPILYNGLPMYVMGCRYLKKNGECGNYHLRPQVCRNWPRIERFGYPEVLRGCGFRAQKRKKSVLD